MVNSNPRKTLFSVQACFVLLLASVGTVTCLGQGTPAILKDRKVAATHYLPDFSFAGYHFGEKEIPVVRETILDVTTFGAKPDDGIDDSKAVAKAVEAAAKVKGPVVVQFPAGTFILSDILYLERSHLVLRGAGSGEGGTTLYYPRPMMYLKNPEPLQELREYLVAQKKQQIEKDNNIDLPYSQYSWAGGYIWSRVPGVRVKGYLDTYDTEPKVLAKALKGKRGEHTVTVAPGSKLVAGDVVQLQWFNLDGEKGSLISTLYDNAPVKPGSHHWTYPTKPLIIQQVQVASVKGNEITLRNPLLHDLKPEWAPVFTEWEHLQEVGIENFRIVFPMAPNIAHHIEEGYNAMFLTRLFNSWVRNVTIENADSGILTEEIANVTIQDVTTSGDKLAHYSVSMGGVHNVLVKRLQVQNKTWHALSFNTFCTKSVYTDCDLGQNPVLDQHSGANHQNLFDNIRATVRLEEGAKRYPLFKGGGASYWKPSHGAFNTIWNLKLNFTGASPADAAIVMDGVSDGASARLVGIHGNRDIKISYGPNAYIERENREVREVPSLYQYQLNKRLQHYKPGKLTQEIK